MDPTSSGSADIQNLKTFSALNSLNVIAVRPILMALHDVDGSHAGLDNILRMVVRRIVVGNLGTGNIERRFSEAARKVVEQGTWEVLHTELSDLDHDRDEFFEELRKRSLNKNILGFIRRSVAQGSITPEPIGVLHQILPRNAQTWGDFGPKDSY